MANIIAVIKTKVDRSFLEDKFVDGRAISICFISLLKNLYSIIDAIDIGIPTMMLPITRAAPNVVSDPATLP